MMLYVKLFGFDIKGRLFTVHC